jgi:two-component system, NtrC family, sensor kinase
MTFSSDSKLHMVQTLFNRLSIRQKIVYTYCLALGIVVLGTITGLGIGNNHFQKAREQMSLADEEGGLLSHFQGVLLEIQSHQQEMVPLLSKPQEFQQESSKLVTRLAEAHSLLYELETFSQKRSEKDLQALLRKHQKTITEYLQEMKSLKQRISILDISPQGLTKAEEFVWQFSQSDESVKFYGVTHELADFARTIRNRQIEADLAQSKAQVLETQIIITSIVLGLVMATIFAMHTSKAIANPIITVTNIAKQAAKEGDFTLQAPVTTKDEIGELASSLNQLIQQVKHLLEARQIESETQLIQTEKMCSLGQMIAGVAHEINNPISFISANLVHAKTYIDDILDLLQTYQAEIPHPPHIIREKIEEIDLEFVEKDLVKLINSMAFGSDRMREIANSLKDFSRVDGGEAQSVDIHNSCMESTLLILNHRLKQGIGVVRKYGKTPLIPGHTGLLYQVFMNLLSNAIDALQEKSLVDSGFSPEITIITEVKENNWVIVRIADNGSGITDDNLQKIFEIFFTTKPRGIGTGLGLAISHQIVADRHGGNITCCSELGKGTEFAIALPIRH